MIFVFALLLNFNVLTQASAQTSELKTVTVKFGDNLKSTKNLDDLLNLNTALKADKKQACLNLIPRLETKFSILKPWLGLFAMRCADRQIHKDRKVYQAALKLAQSQWQNTEYLYVGPQASVFRKELIEFTLMLYEYAQKNDRERIWVLLDHLNGAREELSSQQRGKLYALAADVLLFQQNLKAAQDYYERSLREENNDTIRTKYESLLKKIDSTLTPTLVVKLNTNHSESTPEERELFRRMNESMRSNDYLAAVQDGVKIIREYPGSKNSVEAAKNVLNVYLALVSKSDEKLQPLKDQVLAEMRKADGQRLYDWAQVIVVREKFDDALLLAQDSLEKVGGNPVSSKIILLAAISAHHAADFKRAREFYEILIKRHAGTKISAEGQYRLGLLEFREERYAEAANHFEIFLQNNEGSDFELSALYWLWHSHKMTGATAVKEVGERILKRYPLSYYAMRVRVEAQQNKVTFLATPKKELIWKFALTPRESAAWDRFILLYSTGFIAEAKLEFAQIQEPGQPMGKLIYASIWSELGDYVRSSELIARTFAADDSLISAATLKVAYPIQYFDEIKKESEKYSFSPEIIMSLIKQESSYRIDVRSSAGAMGLMQLMPDTAREIAADLRIKLADTTKDLANPAVNIRIGTQYFQRLLRSYSGHVPLALAAYNAGIGNIRSWIFSRKDLVELEKSRDSSARAELWIDELPWSETSGYIKSIMRNHLVYRFLDQGEYEMPNPVWTFAN